LWVSNKWLWINGSRSGWEWIQWTKKRAS
jgi:hypothetical protein